MDKIKKLIIILLGLCISIIIVSILNYLGEKLFKYSIPVEIDIILFIGLTFLLEKIPFFKNSKIILFEKKEKWKRIINLKTHTQESKRHGWVIGVVFAWSFCSSILIQ